MTLAFHRRYLDLTGEIERQFAVAAWKAGDVDIWPFARMDLHEDMHWQETGARPKPRALPLRIAARLARPLVNRWKCRHDPGNLVPRPHPAHAVLLGDGVSLDRVDGLWRDRFGEPVIAALEKRGLSTLVMQSGDLRRRPWRCPTYPANLVEARGFFGGLAARMPAELPDHDMVLRLLSDNGVAAPSLARARLEHRAAEVGAAATAFERVLAATGAEIAFAVTSYTGLGHAFMLACRRRRILSIDLQHGPQGPGHKAYHWGALPARGYTTLPALFWNWTEQDAAHIRGWTGKLAQPWHQAICGGHTQLANGAMQDWERKFALLAGDAKYEREILVALQPIGGHRRNWETLAAQIEAAPPTWRWWIRRHPASHPRQDAEFGRLLQLPRGLTEEASVLPLPALLPHMDIVLSMASGAAVEAAMFGVPALFLSPAAADLFADLVGQGAARIIAPGEAIAAIANLPPRRGRGPDRQPDLAGILEQVEAMARDYALLCGRHAGIAAK